MQNTIRYVCDNGIPLKVTNQTDHSIKNWDIESSKFLCLVIGLAIGMPILFMSLAVLLAKMFTNYMDFLLC